MSIFPCSATHKCVKVMAGPALVLLSMLVAGCSSKEKKTEPEVTVKIATVQKTAIEGAVEAEAVLYPLKQASITPRITTPVRQFYVQRGTKVHQGQLLAELENRDLTAAEVENKGTYDQAQGEFAIATSSTLPEEMQKAEQDFKAAQGALDAEQKLFASREKLFQEGALPRKDLDQSRVALTQARNTYDLAQKHFAALQAGGGQQRRKVAEGQLESAHGKYLGSSAMLNYSRIVSPIDGVITDRPVYPGETPPPGAPLLVVMDTSKIIAKAHIASDEAGRLKVGSGAVLSAPGLSEGVKGKLTLVSPALDPNSTTVEVWVEVPNKNGELRPGSTMHLAITAEKAQDALVIPASALLTAPDGVTTVMVVTANDHARQQAVEVGIRKADSVQITKGLKSGDRLIVSGAYALPDNTKVKAEAEPSKAESTDKPKGEREKNGEHN